MQSIFVMQKFHATFAAFSNRLTIDFLACCTSSSCLLNFWAHSLQRYLVPKYDYVVVKLLTIGTTIDKPEMQSELMHLTVQPIDHYNIQKVISGILVIIAVTVLMLGSFYSFYSSVYAVSSQSSNAHHKAFVKKQNSGSDSHNGGSSSKDTGNDARGDGSSDNNDVSVSRSHKTFDHSSSIGSNGNDKRSNISISKSSSDNSNKERNSNDNNNDQTGDQGTNDHSNTDADNNLQQSTLGEAHQQSSSNHDYGTTKEDNTTPFVLSLPFP
jgi:hypothetical protein